MKWLFFAVLLLALIFFGSFGFSTSYDISKPRTWDAICAQYSSSEEECLAANVEGHPEWQPDCEWLADKNDCQCNGTICEVLGGRLTYPDRPLPPGVPDIPRKTFSSVALEAVNGLALLFLAYILPAAIVGAFFGFASRKIKNSSLRLILALVGFFVVLLFIVSVNLGTHIFVAEPLTILFMAIVVFLPVLIPFYAGFSALGKEGKTRELLKKLAINTLTVFLVFAAIFLIIFYL